MIISNLINDFSSKEEFLDRIGSINEDIVSINVEKLNELIIQSKKNNNSSSISIFREKTILQPGKAYTISADFVLRQRISHSLPFDVPKFALDGILNGANKFDIYSSLSIPNEVGVWHKSWTVSIPKELSHAWFRIHSGIEKNAGELIIKNLFISETNFEFIFDHRLFKKEGNNFLLKDFNDKDYIQQTIGISELFNKKKYSLVEYIVSKIQNLDIKRKLIIYESLSKNNKDEVIKSLENLVPILGYNDERIASDIVTYLANKSEWNLLDQIFEYLDKKSLFANSSEILYQKAQTYRRLNENKKESDSYSKALLLDKNKAKINWNLFFDKFNPGLTYRRNELKFILDNLEQIQKIADSLTPIDINFEQAPVFVFWDQGYEQAPQLVKTMIDRMKIIYGSRLVILTNENIENYVDLSSGIRRFREKRRALFADYIRTELLMRYGGTWIDSTAFVTKEFYEETKNILSKKENKFYALRIPENPYRISNWFLSTNQINNRIITLMYAALIIFAEKENDIFEYYQYHSFFEILTQLDNKALADFTDSYKDQYQPFSHDLLRNFRNDWDETLFNNIIKKCPIQKLTYKSNVSHLRVNSFYKTILRKATFL